MKPSAVESSTCIPNCVDGVTLASLFAMQRAGRDYLENRRVLEKAGLNLVSEVLRGQGEFAEYEHYPRDDVFDPDTAAQYYYHAHRGTGGEHGHFHTFVRTGHLRFVPRRAGAPTTPHQPVGRKSIAHVVAVSMDAWGWPIGLFVTNRWVTDETWYSAEQVARLLPCFEIDHAWPSLPVNRALGALLQLFRPQILTLLRERDEAIRRRGRERPGTDVLEDRELEVLAEIRIDVDAQVAAVDAWLKGPPRPGESIVRRRATTGGDIGIGEHV